MSVVASAFLVARREDGFGDVYPLVEDQHFTMGRVATNRIVLKDELCSREHAEVFFREGKWRVRDNHSLNGTRVNGERIDGEHELAPGDEIHLGKSQLLFVENLKQLPDLPIQSSQSDSAIAIKKRLLNTRYLAPATETATGEVAETGDPPTLQEPRHRLSRDLSLLYRMALEMGSAPSYPEMVKRVLDGLLNAIPADAGAILSLSEGRELELLAHRQRADLPPSYVKISQYVSQEVMASREAILAEDVAHDQHLRNRESLTELRATSLICAPIIFGEKVLGLVHLYCTDARKALDTEDLEFAVAVARQLGASMHQRERQESLSAENQSLRDQLRVESELVGSSESMKDIEQQIGRVAGTSATVLIRGESGTGKELVARAIHFTSPRREGPFICLNCAALPDTLLESELFGHERGAFTGATEKKIGKFEAADRGTIFLDEIGEMNPGTQAKFLRVLEGHPFERIGGHTQIRVNVRVVAATNQALEQAIQAGSFRRDLFYRLQVVEIRIPPLRERKGDVPLLAEHFLKRFLQETGRKIRGFTPAALKKIEEYNWPGNVRELRNAVERAVALCIGNAIDAKDIWLSSLDVGSPVLANNHGPEYQPLNLEEIEKLHIQKTLDYVDWNKSQAAAILKIERSTLDRKIKAYGLVKR
jgi:Nif-specific regulatory protein